MKTESNSSKSATGPTAIVGTPDLNRKEYAAPVVEPLGSLADLTKGNTVGGAPDTLKTFPSS
jgi:hypothetical protein